MSEKIKKSIFFKNRKLKYKLNNSSDISFISVNNDAAEQSKCKNQATNDKMLSHLYDRLILKIIEDYLNSKVDFSDDLRSIIEKIKNIDHYEKKPPLSAKKEIKNYAFETCQRSSIHGIPFITAKYVPLVVKLIWIVLCIASWAYLTYVIVLLITNYTIYEKSTSVSITYEATSEFPAITICNFSPFYDLKDSIDKLAKERDISIENSNSVMNFTDFVGDVFKAHFENKLEMDTFSAIYYTGFTLKEMLISCEYQGKQCTYKDFYWIRDYNYGNCYRFNGNDPYQNVFDGKFHEHIPYETKKSTVPGWRNGLRMEIFTGDPINQTQYTYKSGVRVIIHNQSIIPFTDEDGVDVSAGSQTNIALYKGFHFRLATPYSDCISELNEEVSKKSPRLADMYRLKKLNKVNKYQQNYCFKVCLHRYLIKQCNCYSHALKFLDFELGNRSVCNTVEQVNCQERKLVEYYSSEDVKNCFTKDCPIECESIVYDTKISTADYPTEWYVGMLNKSNEHRKFYSVYDTKPNFSGPTYDLVKKTTSMINIFFDTVTYTTVTESQSVTFDKLLGNIGGHVGLFTGASILSFVELGDLILSSLIIFIKRSLFASNII